MQVVNFFDGCWQRGSGSMEDDVPSENGGGGGAGEIEGSQDDRRRR